MCVVLCGIGGQYQCGCCECWFVCVVYMDFVVVYGSFVWQCDVFGYVFQCFVGLQCCVEIEQFEFWYVVGCVFEVEWIVECVVEYLYVVVDVDYFVVVVQMVLDQCVLVCVV